MSSVSTSIEVVQLPLSQPNPLDTYFRPFTILLFGDTLRFVNGNGHRDVVISDNSSNVLFPRNTADCDYSVISSYVSIYINLCIGGINRRVYKLGLIDSDNLDRLLAYYTYTQTGTSYTTTYLLYDAALSKGNWAGLMTLISSAPTYVYACHIDDFMANRTAILEYCLQDAFEENCNIFIDTGITLNQGIYQDVLSTCHSFGFYAGNGLHQPLFYAINTPIVHRIDPPLYPLLSHSRFNIIVFSGHTLLKMGNMVHGYIPASSLYGVALHNMSKSNRYYHSCSHSTIYYKPLTPLIFNKNQTDMVYNTAENHKINIPFINDEVWQFHILRTTERNITLGKQENNARLLVDVSRSLISNLKLLLGRNIRDNDELEIAIRGIVDSVVRYTNQHTNYTLKDIKIVNYQLNGNELIISLSIELYTTIESIELTLSVRL